VAFSRWPSELEFSKLRETSKYWENNMSAAIARLLPRASANTIADLDTLVSLGIFCGLGLLLSLTVLIADQYIPGEWF
jgi:hypothetical protein